MQFCLIQIYSRPSFFGVFVCLPSPKKEVLCTFGSAQKEIRRPSPRPWGSVYGISIWGNLLWSQTIAKQLGNAPTDSDLFLFVFGWSATGLDGVQQNWTLFMWAISTRGTKRRNNNTRRVDVSWRELTSVRANSSLSSIEGMVTLPWDTL